MCFEDLLQNVNSSHFQFFDNLNKSRWVSLCIYFVYIELSLCSQSVVQVGQSLYTKGNLLLCKRDYLRLFGSTGYCAACRKVEIF